MTGPAAHPATRLRVVLVEPQHPGNVGAVARAMMNAGLTDLVVVDPPAFDPQQARWMGPGAEAVLHRARLVKTLDEALQGCHRVVATTARHRKDGQAVHSSRGFADWWWDELPADETVALLFGREDFGLSREQVLRASRLLRIPTPEHASLNLAQAVMVVARDWFEAGLARQRLVAKGRTLGGRRGEAPTASLEGGGPADAPKATVDQLEPAVGALVELLERVGYTRSTPAERVAATARDVLQGAGLTTKHAEILRGMVARIDWALSNPDADWKAGTKGR